MTLRQQIPEINDAQWKLLLRMLLELPSFRNETSIDNEHMFVAVIRNDLKEELKEQLTNLIEGKA